MRRRYRALLIGTTLLCGAGCGGQRDGELASEEELGATSAHDRPWGTIQGMNGRVLTRSWGGLSHGTPIGVYPYSGLLAQRWNFRSFSDGTHQITVHPYEVGGVAAPKIDVFGAGDGAPIALKNLQSGTNTHRWRLARSRIVGRGDRALRLDDSPRGARRAIMTSLGQEVDFNGLQIRFDGDQCLAGDDAGSRVYATACSAARTRWIKRVGGLIRNTETNLCLDIAGEGSYPSAPIITRDCDETNPNQRWKVRGEIREAESNRCLDDPSFGQGGFRQVVLWNCWGGPNQQWDYYP